MKKIILSLVLLPGLVLAQGWEPRVSALETNDAIQDSRLSVLELRPLPPFKVVTLDTNSNQLGDIFDGTNITWFLDDGGKAQGPVETTGFVRGVGNMVWSQDNCTGIGYIGRDVDPQGFRQTGNGPSGLLYTWELSSPPVDVFAESVSSLDGTGAPMCSDLSQMAFNAVVVVSLTTDQFVPPFLMYAVE